VHQEGPEGQVIIVARDKRTFGEILADSINQCYSDDEECNGRCANCYIIDNAVDEIRIRIREKVKDRLADAESSIESDFEE